MSDQAYANTDRELWREGGGDGNRMSYYEPSIHVTEQGGIGINVGGTVYTKTLRQWHALAVAEAQERPWYATQPRRSRHLPRFCRFWFRNAYVLYRHPRHPSIPQRSRAFSAWRGVRAVVAGLRLHFQRGRRWP